MSDEQITSDEQKTQPSAKMRKIDNPLFQPTAAGAAQEEAAASEKARARRRKAADAVASTKPVGVPRKREPKGEGKTAVQPTVVMKPEAGRGADVAEQPGTRSDRYSDAAEESATVISIIEDLRRELDTTCEVKDALDADLAATRQKLSDVSAALAATDARVLVLEEQAALAERLRDDVAFAEEERDAKARDLEDARKQLEAAVTERASLAEQLLGAEESLEKLQREIASLKKQRDTLDRELGSAKTQLAQTVEERALLAEKLRSAEKSMGKLQEVNLDLETKVSLLGDKLREADQLREQLQKSVETRRGLEAEVEDLTGRLEAANTSKEALDTEVATAREEIGRLEEMHTRASQSLHELRAQSEEQKTENRNLREVNRRLEHDLKMLTARHEATCNDLEAAKTALGNIHAAAARVRKLRGRPAEGE
jgi:chromosome segregation ATPase